MSVFYDYSARDLEQIGIRSPPVQALTLKIKRTITDDNGSRVPAWLLVPVGKRERLQREKDGWSGAGEWNWGELRGSEGGG